MWTLKTRNLSRQKTQETRQSGNSTKNLRGESMSPFFTVESSPHRHAGAGDCDDLAAQEVDVDALDPVRLHVLEAEPRKVARARAQGVFGGLFPPEILVNGG